MIGAYQHLFGFSCWIFRFANIVGPKVRKKGRTVVSDFIAKLRHDPTSLEILGNGEQAKSYMLSDECVSAMLHVIERAPGPLVICNLGGNVSLNVCRIAEMVVETLGLRNVAFRFTGTEEGGRETCRNSGWTFAISTVSVGVSCATLRNKLWLWRSGLCSTGRYPIESEDFVLQAVLLAGGLGYSPGRDHPPHPQADGPGRRRPLPGAPTPPPAEPGYYRCAAADRLLGRADRSEFREWQSPWPISPLLA